MCEPGRSGDEMHEGIEDTNQECSRCFSLSIRLNSAEHRQCYRNIRTGLRLYPTESVHTDSERTFTLSRLNLSELFFFYVVQRFTLVFTPETVL